MFGRMMLVVLVLVIAISGCGNGDTDTSLNKISHVVALTLKMAGSKKIEVNISNATNSEIVINGLFPIDYAQSVISFEIDGHQKALVSSGSVPVFVDQEKYRINLVPGAIYGATMDVETLAAIYELKTGGCHQLRAIYTPPDKAYDAKIYKSNEIHVCV